MKTQTSNSLSYVYNYLSFLLKIKEAAIKIRAVYLFGSAVRGTLEKKSDIDLFVDCDSVFEEEMKRWVGSAIVQFTSSADFKKWKQLRFTYPLSVQVGNLKEWDLKLSIASEGIVLYALGRALPVGQRMVLFTFSNPLNKKDYIHLRRLLFGRSEEEYRHTGMVHSMRGITVSSTAFLVPQHEHERMGELLSKEKVDFSMKEIVLLEG